MRIRLTPWVIASLLIISITYHPACAQDDPTHNAPTLQIGLSGLSFSRGDLDAALVAEIVAEKQKEVKVKLIKNMLLNKLGVDNGLFYAFIDQNIEILLTEKDEDTRVKNILENVVNLAFVVSYTQYYMATLKPNSPQWTNLKNLGEAMGVDATLFNGPKLSLLDFARVKPRKASSGQTELKEDKQKEIRNRFVGVVIDLFAEAVRQNPSLKTLGVLRTNYLQNYASMNAYLQLKDEALDSSLGPFINTLQNDLDVTAYASQILLLEKIRTALQADTTATLTPQEQTLATEYGNRLKKSANDLVNTVRGLPADKEIIEAAFNENYRTALGTTNINKFIKDTYGIDVPSLTAAQRTQWSPLFWYLDAQVKFKLFDNLLNKKSIADAVFADVANNLSIHVKYFSLIKSLAAKGKNFEAVLKELEKQFNCGSATTYMTGMLTAFKNGRATITDLTKLSSDELKALEKAGSFMDQLRYVQLNQYEYIRMYDEEIRPGLVSLSKYSLEFIEAGKNMEGVINCIAKEVAADLRGINIDLNPAFIDLFTRLDKFDAVETYAQFVNHLSDAGDIFNDDEMRKSINKVLTFVRSYLKVTENDEGKPAITLDVEGFLLNMQRTSYNRWRPFSMHFTVGTNTASFFRSLPLEEGKTLRNYAFIGEKIGVKYKLADWKYLNSFSKGEIFTYYGKTYIRNGPPKEPVVSNVHLLVYGSGLLYNLANTGTTADFNSPIIGFGAGITFFNDLDLNVSTGTALLQDRAFMSKAVPWFINVGFDIQFIEYYNRLQQKRKASKTQKKLAEAAKNK